MSSEKEVILEPGVDTNLLDGEDLVLPIGSYTYFTVIVHNHLNLKHKQKNCIGEKSGGLVTTLRGGGKNIEM